MNDIVAEFVAELTGMVRQRFERPRNAGRPPIGWLSIHTPEELLYAAGTAPYRMAGDLAAGYPQASAYMHPTMCSYILSCFEETLTGVHDPARGVVLVNACDAEKRLYDALRYYGNRGFLEMIDMPRIVNPTTKRYFFHQLQTLKSAVEIHFNRKITDSRLGESIALCNRTRELLRRIAAMKSETPAIMPASKILALVKLSMAGMKQEFNAGLSRLIGRLADAPADSPKPAGNRVLLCGSFFDHPRLLDLIESNGASVVCQDISNGLKYYEGEVGTEEEPVKALADFYLERSSGAGMIDSRRNFKRLRSLIETFQIDSVVYCCLKFCDNHLLIFPEFRRRLSDMGIPVLMIETERTIDNDEQLKTRISAFFENLISFESAG